MRRRCKDCKWHSGKVFHAIGIHCLNREVSERGICTKDNYKRKWWRIGRPK